MKHFIVLITALMFFATTVFSEKPAPNNPPNKTMKEHTTIATDKSDKAKLDSTYQVESDEVVEKYGKWLKSNNIDSREQAVFEIASSKSPRKTELLLLALKDPEPSVRRAAAECLGFDKDKSIIPKLMEASKIENDALVLWNLTSTLNKIGLSDTDQLLLDKYKSKSIITWKDKYKNAKSSKDKLYLMHVLVYFFKDYEYEDDLIDILNSKEDRLSKEKAIAYLQMIKTKKAITAIEKTANDDPDDVVKKRATNALQRMGVKHENK